MISPTEQVTTSHQLSKSQRSPAGKSNRAFIILVAKNTSMKAIVSNASTSVLFIYFTSSKINNLEYQLIINSWYK